MRRLFHKFCSLKKSKQSTDKIKSLLQDARENIIWTTPIPNLDLEGTISNQLGYKYLGICDLPKEQILNQKKF